MRAAMCGSKTNAFQAKRPPGRSAAWTRSKTRTPVGPGRQVEQRAEGDVDQPGRLVQLEVAHVPLAELELDAGRVRALARLREHRG